MARIQIQDLPKLDTMTLEQLKKLFGAGKFKPDMESLEDRMLLASKLGAADMLREAARPDYDAAKVSTVEESIAEKSADSAQNGKADSQTQPDKAQPEKTAEPKAEQAKQTATKSAVDAQKVTDVKMQNDFRTASAQQKAAADKAFTDGMKPSDQVQHEVDTDTQQQELENEIDQFNDELAEEVKQDYGVTDDVIDEGQNGAYDELPEGFGGDHGAVGADLSDGIGGWQASLDGATEAGVAGFEENETKDAYKITLMSGGVIFGTQNSDGSWTLWSQTANDHESEKQVTEEYALALKALAQKKLKQKDDKDDKAQQNPGQNTPDQPNQQEEESFGEKFKQEATKAWNLFVDMFKIEDDAGGANPTEDREGPEMPPEFYKIWADLVDHYQRTKWQSKLGADVDPNPNADPVGMEMGTPPQVPMDWVDGGHIATDFADMPDTPPDVTDGAIDMGPDYLDDADGSGPDSELPQHIGKETKYSGSLSSDSDEDK